MRTPGWKNRFKRMVIRWFDLDPMDDPIIQPRHRARRRTANRGARMNPLANHDL